MTDTDRLLRLCECLDECARVTSGLETDGAFAGRAGRRVRFLSSLGSVAELEVLQDRVTVTTRSEGLNPDAGETEIIDRLGVDLSDGYAWDNVICESADDLAGLLVKHLFRRVKDADPEPRTPAA